MLMSQYTLDYAEPSSRINTFAVRASKRLRRALPYFVIALICYIGSYVVLSKFGEFQPGVMGIHGPKWYAWCPAGLHSGFRQRWTLYYFYLPLYMTDRNYWHRDGDAWTGKYRTRTPSTSAEYKEWRGH